MINNHPITRALVTDNDAAVCETDTGEVLADFILDATNTYQPKKKKSSVDLGPPEGTMSRQSAGEMKKSPESTEE